MSLAAFQRHHRDRRRAFDLAAARQYAVGASAHELPRAQGGLRSREKLGERRPEARTHEEQRSVGSEAGGEGTPDRRFGSPSRLGSRRDSHSRSHLGGV